MDFAIKVRAVDKHGHSMIYELVETIKHQHAMVEELIALVEQFTSLCKSSGSDLIEHIYQCGQLALQASKYSEQACTFAQMKLDIYLLCKPSDSLGESLDRILRQHGLEIRNCRFDQNSFIVPVNSIRTYCWERGNRCRYDFHNTYGPIE